MSAAGPPAFRLATEQRNGVRVLTPEGELDLATAPQLADAFGDGPIVLVLGGLDFIDSTGLATLISERRRRTEQGSPFILVRGSATTQRLFAVTGVEGLFAWASTADEAVGQARRRDGRRPGGRHRGREARARHARPGRRRARGVANTGDDVEIYGAYVSPDPDLCAFWLADRIDERGWGLRDDTFNVMDGMRELGVDVWFNLGDRDLAVGLRRAELLAGGVRLTETLAELTRSLGLGARVLPMSDDAGPHVGARARALGAVPGVHDPQRAAGPVDGVELRGVEAATPSPEVLEAIASARAVVIGPSNPVISIGPILAVPGIREALRARRDAPVVAVSPLVDGAGAQGADRGLHRMDGAAGERPAAWRSCSATCSTAWSATSDARARCRCCGRTRSWPTPRDAGASRAPR